MSEPDLTQPGGTAQTESDLSADLYEAAQPSEGLAASPRSDGEAREWLALPEARRVLEVMSDAVVEYWAEMGWLRHRRGPDNRLEVLRDDVLFQKAMREELGAIGGEELTPEELDELEAARPGTPPWKRAGADRSR